MIALLAALWFSAGAHAAEPPVLPGPTAHAWSNHLRLWSTVDNRSRPLSIGHEIRLGPNQVADVKRHDRGESSWHPGQDDHPQTFHMDDSSTTITIKPDGSWRSSEGDKGDGCQFAAGQEGRLVLVADGRLWMWVNTFSGYSSTGLPRFEVASGRVDLSSLLGDLSAWNLYTYRDRLASGEAFKVVALPVTEGETDTTRAGYAFYSLSPSRGNVRLIGARLRLDGAEASGRSSAGVGGVFTRVPVVSVGRWAKWSVQVEGLGAAQIGGLVELDRNPPDAIGGARMQARYDRTYGAIEVHSGGGVGVLGVIAPVGLYGATEVGYFDKSAMVTLTGGWNGALGRRQGWVGDVRVGFGSALTGNLQVGRVVRTGRPWDLIVSPRISFVDVDWYQDANIRFPIYAGLHLGTRRAGMRLLGR